MLNNKLIKRRSFRIMMWFVAVLLLIFAGAVTHKLQHPSRHLHALNIENKLNNISINAVAIKNKWLLGDKIATLTPPTRTIEIIKQNNAAFYMVENDSIIGWWGDEFYSDISTIICDSTKVITNFCHRQVAIRRQYNGNRMFALVVTLTENEEINKAIFDDENVQIAPCFVIDHTMISTWHQIKFGDKSFLIQAVTDNKPPIWLYIIGWVGLLILLRMIFVHSLWITTWKNAIPINIIIVLILFVIRVILFYSPSGLYNSEYMTQYFDTPLKDFLFSPINLLINVFFILLQSYFYYLTTPRIRRQYSKYKKFSRFASYFLNLTYRSLMLIYIHWAIVENIYNPDIEVNLFRFFSINFAGFMLYISCGVYFLARMFQNTMQHTPHFAKQFRIDVLCSLPFVIPLLWLLNDQLHGTWIIAIVYSIGFRAIGFLWKRFKKWITVYCIAALITSVYLTSLIVVESNSVNKRIAQEYQKSIIDANYTTPNYSAEKFQNFSYALLDNDKIVLTNNNQTELWSLIPYIKRDTTIYKERFINIISAHKQGTLVISFKYISALDIISLMCFVFFFIFSIGITLGYALNIKMKPRKGRHMNLTVQIQTMIIVVVVVAVATASIVSINYSVENSNVNNRKLVNNLLQTVQNSIKNYEVNDINPIKWMGSWYNFIGKALTHNMAVYGTNGRLLTSHPSNFHTYLIESSAMTSIKDKQNPFHATDQIKQGSKYYTLYFPITNESKTFGYIAIAVADPRSEFNTLPITEELLNIFIIVLFAIIWISLLINWWVTRPVSLIQDALSRTHMMQKIKYRSNRAYNHEINMLIKMYNDMIDSIKRNNLEIAALERQSTWQDLARQIAHDIRNPLTPMQLKVQVLQRKIECETIDIKKSTQETLNVILVQIERINEVVDRLRELAYTNNLTLKKIELLEIINNEISLYNRYENVAVALSNLSGKQNFYIKGDSTQIGRVIGNLLKNAIESINESHKSSGFVHIFIEQFEHDVYIQIADTGNGINELVGERIFQPSYTTKSKGSGLGLPICKRIIEQHNGRITFFMNENGGTTFKIILPAKDYQSD